VQRSDLWTRPKLYHVYQSTTAAQWCWKLLESPLVNRVKRRCSMRRDKLLRSMIEVQVRSGSGCPKTGTTSVDATSAGE
jgi:hypothetical protein